MRIKEISNLKKSLKKLGEDGAFFVQFGKITEPFFEIWSWIQAMVHGSWFMVIMQV